MKTGDDTSSKQKLFCTVQESSFYYLTPFFMDKAVTNALYNELLSMSLYNISCFGMCLDLIQKSIIHQKTVKRTLGHIFCVNYTLLWHQKHIKVSVIRLRLHWISNTDG